jgi:hypothetical protein
VGGTKISGVSEFVVEVSGASEFVCAGSKILVVRLKRAASRTEISESENWNSLEFSVSTRGQGREMGERRGKREQGRGKREEGKGKREQGTGNREQGTGKGKKKNYGDRARGVHEFPENNT